MLSGLETKRDATLLEEQRKEEALSRRADAMAQQRTGRTRDRLLQFAAQKQRTEKSYSELQVTILLYCYTTLLLYYSTTLLLYYSTTLLLY